jgi:hypothetical protein
MGDERIVDDSFSTCEENCRLQDPTPVNGMNANLYRLACVGDGYERPVERVFLSRYVAHDGSEHAVWVDGRGVRELVRC